ncbi:MAG: PepSY-associated TM helix domain-containing protein [Cyclobacteriaceae bacterium]|nr:PepSY-associated TM helix domain-containing protein [Cyclobacteriaceae bacterium]MDH5249391.1 PepSY-associated TM helix domain-containing protein [Cyclobacteriaceae bacterium]
MMIRRLLLKIHFYGGLACFWYLLILGVSSLHFNHHFSFMEKTGDPVFWTRKLQLSGSNATDLVLSETIRDSLALIGWPLPWETRHDSSGAFHFALEQPAKRYVIDYSAANHVVHIAETPKGFWRVFNSLHGSGAVPRAPIMHAWEWYTRVTVAVIVLSVLTGIYVWFTGNQNRKSDLYTLLISLTIAVLWMLQLYTKG